MIKALLTLYAATSLHPGAGSTTGAIDLPVQREVHTSFPTIAASGLKGALRQEASQRGIGNGRLDAVFGPDTGVDNKHAGALLIGEGKLLALPIRSLQSVFYWVTCPLILGRLARDLAQIDPSLPTAVPSVDGNQAFVPQGNTTPDVVFEELDFTAQQNAELSAFLEQTISPLLSDGVGAYYKQKLRRDFAVISDENFQHLSQTGTQVSARIQLDDKKTSQNLWYEETLPSETIFWSFLLARASRAQEAREPGEILGTLREVVEADRPVQLGGNETQGQGWCYARIREGARG